MKIFGNWQLRSPLVKAAAFPISPPKGADPATRNQAVNILPPFGTNPPRGPLADAQADLSARTIIGDPRELWYLSLPSKLTPRQVLIRSRSTST